MNVSNEIPVYTFSGTGSATTAYSGAGALTMTTNAQPVAPRLIGTLWINVTTISSATKLSFKITSDAAGDVVVVPDQVWVPSSYNTGNIGTLVFPLITGQTTATKGTVIVPVNVPCYFTGQTLYLWVKTDAGTCTVTTANLTAVL